MKKLFAALLALASSVALSATLNPIQLLNPAGSTAGQAIVSTGASTAPAWGAIGLNGIGSISANSVLANATGSPASPTAFAMPACNSNSSALQWTAGTGFICTSFPGRLIGVQTFTSSGTYTPSAGTNSVIVEVQGGGGAAGGCAATSASLGAVSGAGGAGGYLKVRMTSGFSGATVTVGGPGTSTSGANAGTAGGNSGFTASYTAIGGAGGIAGAAVTTAVAPGALGGSVSASGTIMSITGGPGTYGLNLESSVVAMPGNGGSSILGTGGLGIVNGTGTVGHGFGAGGGACGLQVSQSAAAGGNGSGGIVIVWEFN